MKRLERLKIVQRIATLEASPPGQGVTSHGQLNGNAADGCHPISSITGLVAALAGKAANDHGHSWDDITGKPALFSGAYADLTGKPALFDGSWGNLTGVPATFSPSAHGHAISEVTGLQGALDGKQAAGSYAAAVHAHAKADVGLGSVDNTSDADKPVSTATQTALNLKQNSLGFTAENSASKGQANGYASLDAGGKVPAAQLPASGSDPWTYARLASDFTTSSATAVDITGLGFAPAANTRYEFEAQLYLRTATASVNPRTGLAWAAGLSDGIGNIDQAQSATAILMARGNINAALLTAVGGLPNTTQSWPATAWGTVQAGATPSGSVRLQLASETAGTVVRAQAGSFIRWRALP